MSPNDTLDRQAQQELKDYEEKLRQELGLEDDNAEQWRKPVERPLLRQSRETTTILFGGLTTAHDELIRDTIQGLGYKVEPLPCPDNVALGIGKEFGNRGQCNPTYYTVGNLVKYCQNLREQGMSVEEIKEQYVFLTAGACGPCRFGMYEAEFRKALKDAGFEGFRVLLFEQEKGISQASGDEAAEEGGIDFTKDFYMGLIKAIMVGDLINDLGYQIRPYEINSGQTNEAIKQAKLIAGDCLRAGEKVEEALLKIRDLFGAVRCDFTRVKPKVKITGEFWAMTTEGDGNYRMGEWLESEGAQVLTEPVSTWVDYLLYIGKHDIMKTYGLPDSDGKVSRFKSLKSYALVAALKLYFRRRYDKYRKILGMKPMILPDQGKIHKLAQSYYNIDLRGGEGHMEVGKNIYAVLEKKAHMVISVKPFGCMPSTQSDGVQSKVVNDYPDCIFIPIETSGDGEVNIKSRVQMKLYEAKVRCREEFARVLEGYGFSLEQFRDYVKSQPEYASSLAEQPHHEVGVAANMIHKVAKAMKRHYSLRVDPKMSIEEVESLARRQAEAEGAVCVNVDEPETAATAQSDECGEDGCPTCTDSLPGEQKHRSIDQTAAAAR
ncbi:MAG: hypothetical protein OEY28_10330 [Nitrospira sp.]|nr:hypothetical protein [Nitrospira sp.]